MDFQLPIFCAVSFCSCLGDLECFSPCTASSEWVGASLGLAVGLLVAEKALPLPPSLLAERAVSFCSVCGSFECLSALTEAPECVSLSSTLGSSVRRTCHSPQAERIRFKCRKENGTRVSKGVGRTGFGVVGWGDKPGV